MQPALKIHPEYITDTKGRKRAIILPIEGYKELLEDINDLAIIAERRKEPVISHSKVIKDLKRNGYLPD